MMIDANEFLSTLKELGCDFFCGVPDSLLSALSRAIEHSNSHQHIIAANEGSAVGIAIGYHLATNNIPVVYLQNSGIGNATNPLTSLADKDVYGIPMLLIVGWRGEIDEFGKQVRDEPQHVKQGKITLQQLEVMGIKAEIIDASCSDTHSILENLIQHTRKHSQPVALVVRKGCFKFDNDSRTTPNEFGLQREDIIQKLVKHFGDQQLILSTTGKISRELFEARKSLQHATFSDFLSVGGMGHVSSIAVGVSHASKQRLICLDGDGSTIMHMGSLAEVARSKNIAHFVLNNGCHESVGGQPTLGFDIDLCGIATAMNYDQVMKVKTEMDFEQFLNQFASLEGSIFVEFVCTKGSRADLGRPTSSPQENKEGFMSRF